MKKLILKTALITFGAAVLLTAAVLALVCVTAPGAMMDLTASLGMERASGYFAWKEYERTEDIDCLVRSFVIAAGNGQDETAVERFEELYKQEGFSEYCEKNAPSGDVFTGYSLRGYLCGLRACAGYHLAKDAAAKKAELDFAISETPSSFPEGNAVSMLALEAIGKKDGAFCKVILAALEEGGFEANARYVQFTEELGKAV